jgi:hypothetical protein
MKVCSVDRAPTQVLCEKAEHLWQPPMLAAPLETRGECVYKKV